jgi:pyruvate dehydrogenase E1 component beta subunit
MHVKLPAMSPTMEEGTLAAWLVKPGDIVKPGQVIAEIETDKATMELESDEAGTVVSLDVAAGTDGVKVGTVIAVIAVEGEEAPGRETAPTARAEEPTETSAVTEVRVEASTPVTAAPALAASFDGPARKQTVREALRDAMAEEMRADDTVFVMGEEVAQYQGAYKVTQGLLEEFGDRRVVDTPITEYGFAGLGVGAAMGGLKPIVEFMTFNFAMQAIDHIINSAAKTNYMSGGQMRCPIVFRGPNGAASRVAAQHSQNYGPWYASVPGLVVLSPYDAADAKGLLKSAIRSPDPVVFLENELLYGQSFDVPVSGEDGGEHLVPIGKARLYREGADVTLVSYSIGVGVALEAAKLLEADGVSAEVLDLRSLRPLDEAAVLASLKKTNRMVVVEEGWPVCGIASEIIAIAMTKGFDDLDAPVLRVTNRDVPLPYANNLEKAALVKAADVVAAVKSII